MGLTPSFAIDTLNYGNIPFLAIGRKGHRVHGPHRKLPYGIDTATTAWHNDPVKTEYSQINPDDERGRDLLNGAPKGIISQAAGTVL
jgi:hypothetical protein